MTVQGSQSCANYMESAADWPPPITRVPLKPKVAQLYAARGPNLRCYRHRNRHILAMNEDES